MRSISQLEQMRGVDIRAVDIASLVDISAIRLDMGAPARQRAWQLMELLGNPYTFRVGDIKVKTVFSTGGKTLHEAVKTYLSSVRA